MNAPSLHVIRQLMASGASDEDVQTYLDAWARPDQTVTESVTLLRSTNAIRQERYRNRKRNNTVTNRNETVTLGGTIGGEDLSLESQKEKKVTLGASVTQVTHPNGEVEEWTDKDIDETFDEDIWPVFPKRQGSNPKKPAKAKFKILVKRGASPFAIYDGAKRLAADCSRNGTEPQFIPQMITWLNQGRWEDGQDQTQVRR